MKKIFCSIIIAGLLISCGNATDGDARTDTTNLTIDTGGIEGNINTNIGERPDTSNGGDTSRSNIKTDVRSSTSTDPGTRKTTPGNDTSRRQ